jgi:Lon protease-like protein
MTGPLPLFLLRTVLFPYMPMSLHVFEDRYQEMMRDCLESGTSFGVVAIREGLEVAGEARPYDVGTLARILDVEKLDNGRMNLVITGATRFRIVRLLPGKPYARAEIEYLGESEADIGASRRQALVAAFERYLRSQPTTSSLDPSSLPEPNETAAYLIAAVINTSLDVRQQLLEADDVPKRIDMEIKILRREEDLLSRQVLPAAVTPDSFSEN